MKYTGKEIELMVEPFSIEHYVIYYRLKKRFNLFNLWNRHEYTWYLSIDTFDRNQPYLYNSFEEAEKVAMRLKKDPASIDKHIKEQNIKYKQYSDQYNEHVASRATRKLI